MLWEYAGGQNTKVLKWDCGTAIPNDPDPKVSRGHAKICNLDPQIVGNMRWGQMDRKNQEMSLRNLKLQKWWANMPKPLGAHLEQQEADSVLKFLGKDLVPGMKKLHS